MKTLLVGFGDSWTFGSELDRPQEQNWLAHLGRKLNAETLNLSCPASSIGHLQVQLFDFIKQSEHYEDYKKIFMVGLTGPTRYLSYSNQLEEFINITPDANYRSGGIHHSGRPPEVVRDFGTMSREIYKLAECVEYNSFLAAQTVFAFQQYCINNDIDSLYFSYFEHIDWHQFNNIIDARTIHNQTITRTLTGQEYSLPEITTNQFFVGKLFHPNQQGHIQIAEILNDLYTKKYTRY
jgi:hypothetical protein